jgi:hypothetical protein
LKYKQIYRNLMRKNKKWKYIKKKQDME